MTHDPPPGIWILPLAAVWRRCGAPRMRPLDERPTLCRIRNLQREPVSSSSEAVTRGIRVQVQSRYLPERSQPEESQWIFVYQVRIANEGNEPARLISRHWIVTDGNGQVEEYKGEGV